MEIEIHLEWKCHSIGKDFTEKFVFGNYKLYIYIYIYIYIDR